MNSRQRHVIEEMELVHAREERQRDTATRALAEQEKQASEQRNTAAHERAAAMAAALAQDTDSDSDSESAASVGGGNAGQRQQAGTTAPSSTPTTTTTATAASAAATTATSTGPSKGTQDALAAILANLEAKKREEDERKRQRIFGGTSISAKYLPQTTGGPALGGLPHPASQQQQHSTPAPASAPASAPAPAQPNPQAPEGARVAQATNGHNGTTETPAPARTPRWTQKQQRRQLKAELRTAMARADADPDSSAEQVAQLTLRLLRMEVQPNKGFEDKNFYGPAAIWNNPKQYAYPHSSALRLLHMSDVDTPVSVCVTTDEPVQIQSWSSDGCAPRRCAG